MCETCEKQIIEMDIRESDLPGLPYKLVKWKCVVKSCNHYTRMKDYGLKPLFWWARGGKFKWVDITIHFLLCHKHSKIWNKRHVEGLQDPLFPMPKNQAELDATIIPILKSKLYKK
jgi:hypothetical protein